MKAVDYIRVSTAEQAELSLTYSYFLVDGVTIKSRQNSDVKSK